MLSLSACRSSCRVVLDTLLTLGSNCALRDAKLIVRLYAHPHIWRCAEVPAESECRVGGYRTFAVDNGTDAARGHCDIAGEPIDARRSQRFALDSNQVIFFSDIQFAKQSSRFRPLSCIRIESEAVSGATQAKFGAYRVNAMSRIRTNVIMSSQCEYALNDN